MEEHICATKNVVRGKALFILTCKQQKTTKGLARKKEIERASMLLIWQSVNSSFQELGYIGYKGRRYSEKTLLSKALYIHTKDDMTFLTNYLPRKN